MMGVNDGRRSAMRGAAIGLLLLASSCTETPGKTDQPPPAAGIDVTAAADGDWTISYVLPAPASALTFARSPDASRGEDWTAPDGFEIVRIDGVEIARRVDGEAFSSVAFGVPPRYRELPKDYAPFMPYGDGGRLFYTGRLFACAGECPDDATWAMRLVAPDGQGVLLDGRRLTGEASWTDSGQGRNVYVGEAEPVVSGDVAAVIDAALPTRIRDQLETQLPRFMTYFTQKLGRLNYRPMLFASYDASPHDGRSGRQGGTLPGQVFVHFYGDAWPEKIVEPGLADELAWFFAHEAGHMYQQDAWATGAAHAWIHEGAAEAFAALALRADGVASADAVAEKIAGSERECAAITADRSVREAIEAGDFHAAYTCGLVIALAIDAAVRKAAPDSDGLYAVWRSFIAAWPKGEHSEEGFLAAVAETGGQALADAVRAAVRTPGAELDRLGAAPR